MSLITARYHSGKWPLLGAVHQIPVNVKHRSPEKVIAEEVLNAQGAIVAVTDTQGVFMYLGNRYNMWERAWRSR